MLSAAPRASLTLPSCSPNYPRTSQIGWTHATHCPSLNFTIKEKLQNKCVQNVEETGKLHATEVFYRMMKYCKSTQMTASSVLAALWLEINLEL